MRYSIAEDGKEVLVLWAARDLPEFGAMRMDYEKFAAATLSRAWAEAIKAIDGFPMERESAGVKTTVTKLERKPTPAREFEAPKK